MPNPSSSLPLIGRLQNLLEMANFRCIGKSGDDMYFLSEMMYESLGWLSVGEMGNSLRQLNFRSFIKTIIK